MTNSCDQRGPRSLLVTAAPDCPTAVVKVNLDGPGVVVVVSGEIDASNADQVSDYIHRSVPDHPAVIVDVTDVAFLGVQGLRALIALGEECGRAGVTWAVVASQSIIRLLRLMRRGDLLPTFASLAEALQQMPVEADRR